jgi:hypothetical protein
MPYAVGLCPSTLVGMPRSLFAAATSLRDNRLAIQMRQSTRRFKSSFPIPEP